VIALDVSQNIKEIIDKIEAAASKSGRNKEEIKLVAVSKTQPVEKMIEAKMCGLKAFGENKVQELMNKYPLIEDVEWHFIGHLQRNKVKYIIDKVSLIHSLDSISLAEEIDKRAKKIGRVMPVLIQVNIGKEESKSGVFEEDFENFVEKLSVFENIEIQGLMTIPPRCDLKEQNRAYFRKMKNLFDELKKYSFKNFNIKYLSMGMTDDYEIAIEEGANIIRIGTGIFGERNYTK
jgi:pyridoxal phosphate enzyme (YggS family)